MTRNLLDQETSPYLLQHKDNPVHWRPWGPAALDEARAADRPILLSIGYAACHWCHVMAHESFENPEIAAVMNDLFVSIKVDREERPDIDAIYMSALQLLGSQGGWPLTMFLTPDGEPFWGGTYFPPESRWGQPGFVDIMKRIDQVWREERETVDQNRMALVQRLGLMASAESDGGSLREDSLEQLAAKLINSVDFSRGGLSGTPKFPNPPIFRLFWQAYRKTGEPSYKRAVDLLLDRMSEGGIYDHIGGGYARYSVDDRWLVPHFEKMLYDNAQIIELLTSAWLDDRNPLFEQRLRETIAWAAREMIAENGAFAASQDADSEGEEGKFYVWSATELQEFLGTNTDLFAQIYDVSPRGNFEGRNILNRLHLREKPDEDTETLMTRLRGLLFTVRDARIHPGWDDKVLADWNGLMIAALAGAAAAFDEPAWMALAETAFAAIMRDQTRTDSAGNSRLLHSYRAAKAQHEGMLDDYANMARAALQLYETTGKPAYLGHAEAWARTVDARFRDRGNGGYYFTADDAEALIVRSRHATDNAVPAGNGVMVEVFAKLALLTGDAAWRDRAEQLVSGFAAAVANQAPAHATLLCGFDLLLNADQIVIVGDRDAPDAQAMLRVVFGVSLPNRIVQVVPDGPALPPTHPASGKTRTGGRATAYICHGQTCSLPITDDSALREKLAGGAP
ncbi:thioredoxin domain-containing protein [Emcibacter sp. SYSU 3D8]|uniref:thioredoxin domain-containing protein n=1 Tax=Emcibacter sp. SYSU 3D8 TaxID=3133969 RepID=UPI0031FE44D6